MINHYFRILGFENLSSGKRKYVLTPRVVLRIIPSFHWIPKPLIHVINPDSVRGCLHASLLLSPLIYTSFSNVPFQGSLCGFMCCCIFYSIRIFGKLWPQQQVNDVGNFFLFNHFFPSLSLWSGFCDKLLAFTWPFNDCFKSCFYTLHLHPPNCLYVWIINSAALPQLKHWFYIMSIVL